MSDAVLTAVWFVVVVLGGGYSTWNLRDAWRDRVALRSAGVDGVFELTAGGNIRREAIRVVFWTLALAVGVAAVLLPDTDAAGTVIGLLLITVMALNAYNSFKDGGERRAVRAHVKEGTTT